MKARPIHVGLIVWALLAEGGRVAADTITWANTGTDFNAGASWIGNVAPGANDIAAFPATVTTLPVLSGNASVLGLQFANASGWTLRSDASGPWTLTLGAAGITNLNATTLGSATAANNVNILLAASQGWNAGGALTVYSVVDDGPNDYGITKSGPSSLTLNGANTWSGGIVVNAGSLSFASEANLGGAHADVTLNGGGYLLFTGTGTHTIDLSVGPGVSGGIWLSNNSLTLGQDLTFTGTSTFRLSNGTLNAAPGASIRIDGATTFVNDFQNNCGMTVNAPVVLNNANLMISVGGYAASRTIVLGGSISGTGNVSILGVGGGWNSGISGNNTFVGELLAYGWVNVWGGQQRDHQDHLQGWG